MPAKVWSRTTKTLLFKLFFQQKVQNQHNQEVRLVPEYFLGHGVVCRRVGNTFQVKKHFQVHPTSPFSGMSDNQKFADQLWAVKKN